MNLHRWKEIDRVFAAVLELEPDARAAYLDKTCADDTELRKEVESLLANDVPESLMGHQAFEEATRLLTPAAAHPPKHIGPYRIIRSLGAGGMGHVYLAHDEKLNRPVAVKLLAGYNLAEAERIRRFRREALAASALNHPNILTIYEIGEDQGQNFIATEFVDGQTLLELVKNGPVSVTKTTDVGIQICSALSAAHAAGIIHRDIKPANIMVRDDGLLKVLDFGIAKYGEADGSPDDQSQIRTAAGTVIGTVAYMSPEQARGLPIDQRTDLWSAGVILYELVAGVKAFHGETPLDTMAAVIERPPLPLSAHGHAPEMLEQIVFKALKKDRQARYQTAGEMITDLKQLAKNLEAGDENAMRSVHATKGPAAALTDNEKESVDVAEIKTSAPDRVSTSEGNREKVEEPHQAPRSLNRSGRNRKLILVGLALVLLVVIGLIYWSYANRRPQISSIAVMPFVNDSGNGEVEYLSDGMTDSLITNLSQLPQLSVKARSSVFRYKNNKDASPQQVGKELNVQAVLNGRVIQRGNDVTLHIELVDVNTETALWSGDYNRSMTNLATLQGEIARDVSQKLRVRLSGADERRVARNYTANTEAYQLYLKGRYHVLKVTLPETQTGISYFQQAIDIDPSYALAYVGLAGANRALALSGELPATEYMPKAKAAAQKAIEIDDTLAEAHSELGLTMLWYDWDWNASENQCKRALELDSSNPDAHMAYAHLLSNAGRHAEALAEAKRARELDPLNLKNNALEGLFLIHAGRIDEGLDRLQKTFELDPNFWFAHLFASSAYSEKEMFDKAVAEARKARDFSGGGNSVSMAFLGYALAKSGKQAEARAVLKELSKLSATRYVPPYHIALVYNGLGEREQALLFLERGYNEHDPKMAFLKVEPKWNSLRSDPRFQNLMKRVGFRS